MNTTGLQTGKRKLLKGVVPLGLLVALVVASVVAVKGTGAVLSSETNNPSNTFASTSLPQPVIVSSHQTINNGLVSLNWTPTNSFATSYEIQRSTSGSGPFTTLATVTTGVSGFTEFTVPTAASQPGGITWGPDGNLWFTEVAANKIGKLTPSGTFTEYTVTTANSQPTKIVSGPDGNLWFTEYNANKVAKITTSGTITEYSLTTASSQPRDITVGSDGNLWVGGQNSNKVAKVTTSGTVTEYGGLNAGSQPYDIVSGPDNLIYFTQTNTSKIGSFDTSGSLQGQTATPTASSAPKGITAGPWGAVRFAESAATKDKIGNRPMYGDSLAMTDTGTGITANSSPTYVTNGADGNLWFTELNGNKIARMDSANTVTEYSVPTAASQPTDITTGPDGNIWFTEAAGNKIGRYGLNLSTTWVDTTAAFNTQYHYQVIAHYLSWDRTGPVQSALSLKPTSGTNNATGTPAALTAGNLTNMSIAETTTFDAGNWALDYPQTNNLKGIDMLDASTGWAVGASGTILKTTNGGITWTTETSNTGANLEGIFALDATHVWAVGAGGVIDFYNGTTWATQTSNTGNNLNAVWALDSTHVWAAGATGTIDFYNGTTWTVQGTGGVTDNLNAVGGLNATNVWTGGQNGRVMFYNGTSWASQTSGTTKQMQDVVAVDSTHVWFAGDSGTMLFWNGSAWSTQTTPGTSNLHGLAMADNTHGWGFGAGEIYYWNGTAWSDITPAAPLTGNWEAGDSIDATHAIGVGASGQMGLTADGTTFSPIIAEYVEFRFSGSAASGSTISSVKANLVWKTSAAPSTSVFTLLVSGDAGTTWTAYSITNPGGTTTQTTTIDITGTINTPTKVANMYLRFVDAIPGGGYKTNHDLVQVQVN